MSVCRMFTQIIAGKSLPRHLSFDHDPLFRFHRWLANLRILYKGSASMKLVKRVAKRQFIRARGTDFASWILVGHHLQTECLIVSL